MTADYRHLHEFQLQSIYAVRKAMEHAAGLTSGSRYDELNDFYRQYRTRWEVASGLTSDAIRFRKDLLKAGETALPQQEAELLADLKSAIQTNQGYRIQQDLKGLYEVNVRYAVFANHSVMDRLKNSRIRLVVLGSAGIILTLFLGLRVRRAIAPRIQRLVQFVRRFQNGTYEQISDSGTDDIAVLTNALNSGFSAIAWRQHEREEFMAVAAHELKTPVASIYGYASLLQSYSQPAPVLFHALEVIYRQSWRLSRLIETLFLATETKNGHLHFEPSPLNLSSVVCQVLHEMEALLSRYVFTTHIQENVSILGDESLLEHALWSLFTCAASLSLEKSALQISLSQPDHFARLSVEIEKSNIPIPEIQELFTPFRAMEYETDSGIRLGVGLYLCREIVRVHNGQLLVLKTPEDKPGFVMELPL